MSRRPWSTTFFAGDQHAREALPLLAPELHNADLVSEAAEQLGPRIRDHGEQLYRKGSLKDLPTWEFEESPEFDDSVRLWGEALREPQSTEFTSKVASAAKLAEGAFTQMGKLAPRLAALRWCCCMGWISARAHLLDDVSPGGSLGTVNAAKNGAALRAAKALIFGWLRDVLREARVLALYDFDLVGHGVWINGGREPLPEEAQAEWFRRGVEFDLAKLCLQALALPPADLNVTPPFLAIVRPHGQRSWDLPPPEAPRHILDRHQWLMELVQAPIDESSKNGVILGNVLEADKPPEPFFDYDDPEIIAKVQRGEDLGKGDQEDGLPGSVHGSVSLLYAAHCTCERIEHLRLYPALLELDGFCDNLFRYGPPFRSLDLRGCVGYVNKEVINLLFYLGPSLTHLYLGTCGVNAELSDELVDALCDLPGLQHLDLSDNVLDDVAALDFISQLADERIDIPSVSFDGNPISDRESFCHKVAETLATRGEHVIAGGDLVLHMGTTGVRWRAEQRPPPPTGTAIKELRRHAEKKRTAHRKYEEEDPEANTEGGQKWLAVQKKKTTGVLDSTVLRLYREELSHVAALKDEAAAQAEADSQAKVNEELNKGAAEKGS